jgi:hypothetical protein
MITLGLKGYQGTNTLAYSVYSKVFEEADYDSVDFGFSLCLFFFVCWPVLVCHLSAKGQSLRAGSNQP